MGEKQQSYDNQDLFSTLCYMRDKFEIGIFQDTKRMYSILCDLSPALKRDGRILLMLAGMGMFQELEETDFSNELKKTIVAGRISSGLKREYIEEERAVYYSDLLCKLYGEAAGNFGKNGSQQTQTATEKEVPFVIENGILKNYTGNGRNVVIPKGVITIGTDAFQTCRTFLEQAELQEGLEEIGERAFEYCINLKNIVFPSSLKKIGMNAFVACDRLERIELKEGIEEISCCAFAGCKNLKSVILPSSVRIIEESAFAECKNLISITIKSSKILICENAFSGCGRLESLKIPDVEITEMKRAGDDTKNVIKRESASEVIIIENGAFPTGIIEKDIIVRNKEQAFASLVQKRHRFVTEEHLEHAIEIEKAEILSRLIAAGDQHSVAVKSDGSVIAKGDNQYGQCEVGYWEDIVMVAAAKDFTIGLKINGTIVFTGKFTEKEKAGLAEWTDLIDISVSDSCKIGLKRNGTVVAMGNMSHYQGSRPEEWKEIVSVVAGNDFIAGITSEGKAVVYGLDHKGRCDTESFVNENIVSIAGSRDLLCGVTCSGRAFSAGFEEENGIRVSNQSRWNLPKYKNMVYVMTSYLLHVVGICKDDHNLIADREFPNIQKYKNLRAICLGKHHEIGITSTGMTVVASTGIYFSTCNKKTDISGEQLFLDPKEVYERILKLRTAKK